MKLLTEEQVLRALGQQLDLPFSAKLSLDEITPELIRRLPINFAKQNKLIPLREEDGVLIVAISDPLDTATLDEARMLLERPVVAHLAPAQSILDAINQVYDRAANESERLMDDPGRPRISTAWRTSSRSRRTSSMRPTTKPPSSGSSTR